MNGLDTRQVGERIYKARSALRLTQKELADMVGVSQTTIASYEQGKASPSLTVLASLSHALNKPIAYFFDDSCAGDVSEILSALRSLRLSAQLPLLGSIPASNWQDVITDVVEYVDVPASLVKIADYALVVKGDSMRPTLMDGDIVYVRQGCDFKQRDIVVARNPDGEVTLKRAIKHAGKVWLRPDNPDYDLLDATNAEILGVVVGMFRREP